MSKMKKIAILAVIAMVLTMMPAAMFAATATDTRLAGADRVSTALEIASAGTWGTTVVLAPADQANLVDALAAAPLAGQENAPILLTFKGSLDAGVKAKIAALGATKVYVVGAISAAVAAEVDAISGVTVEVLQGPGRQATAAAVNAKLTSPAGTFVVGYDAIADALSVASYAAKNKFAIVLTNQAGDLDGAALVGATKYIVGGTTKVNDIAGVTRLSGADRFATNTAVAATLSFSYGRVYVANGMSLVDALSVAPLAAKYDAFVVLASANGVASIAGVNGSTQVIAVGGLNAVSDAVKGMVYVAPATLTVESVSALNAKQIQVVFSKAVDKDTITVDNFDVTQKNDAAGSDRLASATETNIGTAATGAAKLQSDNKTVLLTLDQTAALTNPTTATVIVRKAVKDADGTALAADVTMTASFSDSTVPSVTSITQTGNDKIEVKFNEAIKDSGNDTGAFGVDDFIIDDYAVAITSVAWKSASAIDTLVITASGTIPNGEHTLTVNPTAGDLVDYATFRVVKADIDFTINADTTIPSVTAVSKSEAKVRFTFSKEVVIPTADANIEFRYAYNASGALKIATNSASFSTVANTNNTQYDVTFASPLNPGSANVYITYVSDTSSANRIKDLYDNVLPTGTMVSFTVSADTTAPTVTSVTSPDATTFEVVYSEAVTGADVPTNYTVTDPNGDAVAVTGAILKAGTTSTYTLTVASMSEGGAYKFEINTNVKDVSTAANKIAAYSTNLAIDDDSKPTIVAATINSARDTVTIEFSEAMAESGANSAIDKANYRTAVGSGGVQSTLPDGTTITQTGTVVTIKFTSALASAQDYLEIGQVADVAGNKIAKLQTEDALNTLDTFTATVSKVKFIATNKISFEVNRQLKAITAANITVDQAVDEVATSATWVNNADGTATVTANFADDSFDTGLATIANVDFAASSFQDTNDVYSATLSNVALTTKSDVIAPKISKYWTLDTDFDGKIDSVVVSYTEDLYVASVSEADYTVAGYAITGVTVDNAGTITSDAADVVISVTEKATPDTAVTPKVTQVGTVEDISGQHNVLVAQSEKTSTDMAAPAITGVAMDMSGNGDAKKIVFTFSEAVTVANFDATKVSIDNTIAAFGAGVALAAGTETQTASNVITVTALTAAKVSAIQVKDSIGDATSVFYLALDAAAMTDGTNANLAKNGVEVTSFVADTTAPRIIAAVADAATLIAGQTVTITYDDYMTVAADKTANYTRTGGTATLIDGTATVDASGDLDTATATLAAGEKITADATVVDIATNAVNTSYDTITCPADATTAWAISAN